VAGAAPRAVIFGLAGPQASDDELRFFRDADPLGFILFARNCVEPVQVRALVETLRGTVGRADAPVLIDQEGGRVQRLRPPHWRAAPPAAVFGALCGDESDDDSGDDIDDDSRGRSRAAVEACYLNARLLGCELSALGISVDCAPMLDVRQPFGHDIIGDRAFAFDPQTVALLGRATCSGLLAEGVLPVIKHIPGHGRATLDSHLALPVVDAPLADLERVDFAPFAALAHHAPMAMTAHVVYSAIDPLAPASTSRAVVERAIRGAIGFDGLLISDDLCMRALAGTPVERAAAVLAAGCDVALHCNGELPEMRAVADACPPLTAMAQERIARAEVLRRAPIAAPLDRPEAERRLAVLLGAAAVA